MTEIDRKDVVYAVQTIAEVVSGSLAARKMSTVPLGIFAALALVLASIGICGVTSYVVGQRAQEIGDYVVRTK